MTKLLPVLVPAFMAMCIGAGAALAATTRYECKFDESASWIPSQLVLTDDEATGKIIALDPIIQTYIGTPVEAELKKRTNARATYTWEVRTVSATGQNTRMRYTFTYYSNGLPATMSARPGSYDNVFSGDGTCKVTKG